MLLKFAIQDFFEEQTKLGVVIIKKSTTNGSFSYGLVTSFIVYLVSSFLFFWFSVFRRMAVLNISFMFDSDVSFAVIIVPMMVAIPWLPGGIITGLASWKKGNEFALKLLAVLTILISIGLAMVFWSLPYN